MIARTFAILFSVVAILVGLANVVGSAIFEDDFNTNPYSNTSPRWCERLHHWHWDGSSMRGWN